jgi:hypothetical protein
MITAQLRDYIDRVIAAKQISADDVRELQRRVLENGLASRHEAEALLALDRALPTDESWGDALVALMLDFVVWGSRPTGRITAEDARWLAVALEVDAPSETALRIARAIIDEAEEVDEALISLVLRARRTVPQGLAA